MADETKSMAYWDKMVANYKIPSLTRSIYQIISTFIFLAISCYAMYLTQENYYWATLILSLFAGGFVVKLFIIQHDCGHGSFFKSKKANDITGRLLTAFTMTPYGQWAKEHNRHHATSGNLSHRGVGDVTTFTVKEYKKASKLKKFLYRFYRNPLFLFSFGAFIHFLIKQRLAFYKPKKLDSWVSVMWTNVYIATIAGIFIHFIGAAAFFKIYLPIAIVAATVGTWMFYVQHQYEETYWERKEEWNYCDAARHGSSFYDLPKWLHWITGNIGYHHIHHLSSKIPNYNLAKCFNENPQLQEAHKFTIWESKKCLKVALWDEDNKKMVGFNAL